MSIPGELSFLADPERSAQVAQHAQIVERMNFAHDDLCQRTHPRSFVWCIGQQWKLRICLIEILDDCKRLRKPVLAVFEHRYQRLRIDGSERSRELLAAVARQMDIDILVSEVLEVQRDPHAV